MSPCVPQAVPHGLINAADNDMNVILGDLVQAKDLDLIAPSCQPAEIIDSGMIDVKI